MAIVILWLFKLVLSIINCLINFDYAFSIFQFYGGSISEGSELQIEVAEFMWRNVEVVVF